MKRKTIFGLMVGLAIASTVLVKEPIKVDATHNITSPTLKCSSMKYLEKGDSSGLLGNVATISCIDNTLNFSVNNITLAADEKLFVVGISKAKKEQIYSFLEKGIRDYSAQIKLPHYYDAVDFHIYKQKSSEPDYTLRSENFVGRTKVYMANILNYKRGEGTALTVYDKDWAKVSDDKNKSFLSRITPNYFTLQSIVAKREYDKVGKIILSDEQSGLMTEDEKIVPSEYFTPDKMPGTDETWPNASSKQAEIFNFYLPTAVKEFKFVIYKNNISDKKEDIIAQYHIKLDRK